MASCKTSLGTIHNFSSPPSCVESGILSCTHVLFYSLLYIHSQKIYSSSAFSELTSTCSGCKGCGTNQGSDSSSEEDRPPPKRARGSGARGLGRGVRDPGMGVWGRGRGVRGHGRGRRRARCTTQDLSDSWYVCGVSKYYRVAGKFGEH